MITGDFKAMSQLGRQLAEDGKYELAIQNALLVGDVDHLSHLLLQIDQPTLAVALNKMNGNDSEALRIESEYGISLKNFETSGERMRPHTGILTSSDPWPTVRPIVELLSPGVQAAVMNLRNQRESEEASFSSQPQPDVANGWEFEGEGLEGLESSEEPQFLAGDDIVDELALALEAEEEALGTRQKTEPNHFIDTTPREHPLIEAWKSSRVPVRHVMARSMDSAKKLLTEQAGVTQFEPLERLFNLISTASHYQVPSSDPNNPIFVPSPAPPLYNFSNIRESVDSAHELFTAGKFSDAIPAYRRIIHMVLLSEVADSAQQAEALNVIQTCREYILALSIEIARKEAVMSPNARPLELTLYFAHRQLRNDHRQLAMRAAVTSLFKAKCYKSAGDIAKRLLDSNLSDEAFLSQLRKLLAICERSASSTGGVVKDTIELVSDEGKSICARTFTVIEEGNLVSCVICNANYDSPHAPKICQVCQLRELASPLLPSGLVLC